MNNQFGWPFPSLISSPPRLACKKNANRFQDVKLKFEVYSNLSKILKENFINEISMPRNEIDLKDLLQCIAKPNSNPDFRAHAIKKFLVTFNGCVNEFDIMGDFFKKFIFFLQQGKNNMIVPVVTTTATTQVVCNIKLEEYDLTNFIEYKGHKFSNNKNHLGEPIDSLVTYFNSLISPQPLLNRKVIACFVIILASFSGFAGYVARGAIASRYGNPCPDFSNRSTNNYSNIINDTKRITFDSSYVAEPWLPPKLSEDPKIFREGFNFIAQFDGKKFELKARGFQKIYNFFSNENHKMYSLVNAQDMINNKLLKSNENRGRSYVKVTSDFSNEALHHSKFRLWVEFRDFGNKDYRNGLRRRKKDVKQNLSKGVKDVKDVLKRNNYRVYGRSVSKVFEPGNTILDACGYKNESKCILKEKKEQNVKNIS